MQINPAGLTAPQAKLVQYLWRCRDRWPVLQLLTLITEPATRNKYVALLASRPPTCGLVVLFARERTDYLRRLEREGYDVRDYVDWQAAVRGVFRYFRGVIPPEVDQELTTAESGGDHWRTKLGGYLAALQTARKRLQICNLATPERRRFNVDQFLQLKLSAKIHPELLITAINQLATNWQAVGNPWGYLEAILTREQRNYNEREAILLHEQIKIEGNLPVELDQYKDLLKSI